MWQVLDGSRPAKSCATHEFVSIVPGVHQEIERRLDEPGNEAAKAIFARCKNETYVFDHVRYHETGDELLTYEHGWFERLPTPPWSPDFNKPAEHALGRIKRSFKARVVTPGPNPDMSQLRATLEECAREENQQGTIYRDVHSLPLMWRVIKAGQNEEVEGPAGKKYRGVAGFWTPHQLR